MNLQQITDILRANKEFIHQHYKADVKGIFGSYSRGDQKTGSDVDILVAFEKGATLLTLSGLTSYLQDKIGIRVDVVSEGALKKKLRPYIENDLIQL